MRGAEATGGLDAPRARLAALGGALALAFAASLCLGSVRIPGRALLGILFGSDAPHAAWRDVIYLIRLPKALTALLAGAALAVSGLQMQTVFLNPLAGPFVLGINAGASLGVALVVMAGGSALLFPDGALLFLNRLGSVGAAVAGAAAVLALVLALARRVSVVTLIVLGLMVSYAVSAAVSLLMYFSVPERVQAFLAWSFGSFGGVTWPELAVLSPVIGAGLILAGACAKPLNALLLGEEYALSLGIRVRRARWAVLLCASVLAGAVTVFAGPIAFIGVAVPHLCRAWLRTSNHLWLLPACLLLGGTTALVADLIAQAPGWAIALPLNAVTSLCGPPVVIWALLRRRDAQTPFAS